MQPEQLRLRDLEPRDFDQLFEDQRDPLARHMAAFGAPDADDREAFDRKWERTLASDSIKTRALELNGTLVGYLISFEQEGSRQVGYWISRSYWGRGLATRGLRLF
jgi:RimJ/RimL family protein N-acetyltransferase